MTEPFKRRKLERYRIPAIEQSIRAAGQKDSVRPGVIIAGDIVIGRKSEAKSIRFSFSEITDPGYEGEWIMALSAEGQTRCTDGDIKRFCKYAEMAGQATEMPNQGHSPYVRSFKLR